MANGVYAEKELKYVEKFQNIKAILFKPLLYILSTLNISANQISFLSFFISISSLGYSLHSFNPVYFLIGIWIHIFLDSLDGPLARFQGKASKVGSFIDVICDHVGILASGFYMLSFTQINPLAVLLFITLYTINRNCSLPFFWVYQMQIWMIIPRLMARRHSCLSFFRVKELRPISV